MNPPRQSQSSFPCLHMCHANSLIAHCTICLVAVNERAPAKCFAIVTMPYYTGAIIQPIEGAPRFQFAHHSPPDRISRQRNAGTAGQRGKAVTLSDHCYTFSICSMVYSRYLLRVMSLSCPVGMSALSFRRGIGIFRAPRLVPPPYMCKCKLCKLQGLHTSFPAKQLE